MRKKEEKKTEFPPTPIGGHREVRMRKGKLPSEGIQVQVRIRIGVRVWAAHVQTRDIPFFSVATSALRFLVF